MWSKLKTGEQPQMQVMLSAVDQAIKQQRRAQARVGAAPHEDFAQLQ